MSKGIPDIRVFPNCDGTKGINLREYIAAYALQGVIAAHGQTGIEADNAARKAIEYTNALLRELCREQSE